MTDSFETRLKGLAQGFSYPRTPHIAEKVMPRLQKAPARFKKPRLAWGLAILLVLTTGLMAVSPVRAAVLELIQIGVVRIFLRGNTPVPTVEPIRTISPESVVPLTATPASTSLNTFMDRIAGEVTLEQARARARFPIPLPTYPKSLGEPDRIYLQDLNGMMVILVWENQQHPEDVDMSLHMIEAGSWAIEKNKPTLVEETTVHGQYAAWTVGPYPLTLRDGNVEFTRLIDGHVLIWAVGNITYRLETDLSMEEAVQIAESLQPPPVETLTP